MTGLFSMGGSWSHGWSSPHTAATAASSASPHLWCTALSPAQLCRHSLPRLLAAGLQQDLAAAPHSKGIPKALLGPSFKRRHGCSTHTPPAPCRGSTWGFTSAPSPGMQTAGLSPGSSTRARALTQTWLTWSCPTASFPSLVAQPLLLPVFMRMGSARPMSRSPSACSRCTTCSRTSP